MTKLPEIPPKRYFTIGEVGDLCGVKPHVLRYWEQEFAQLKPVKRRGNRRYYQHHEVLMIRRIRELLYDHGYTISGARNQLADTKLYAPFDGYVKRRRFDPPTVVAAGMPVITFLSGKNPEVELFIPASTYIRRREIASFAAVFDFLQGQKIPLRLLHVDPSANANQLYAVRLALPVNTEIAATPGMNATVEVAMRQETEASVEIPASALFSNGDKTSYVWIYRQDGTIARRRVEVVRLHTDGTATIADGLNEGERIVVAGVHKLTEGQRVAPLPAPSKTNEGGLL